MTKNFKALSETMREKNACERKKFARIKKNANDD
jgi:hypothetical protein